MAKLTWNDVQEKLESLDYTWNSASTNGNLYQIEVEKYSPAGQDCTHVLECDKDNPASISEAFKELYENYDPEQEAMLWLGPDGHGKNGAPYHMQDLLDDMKAVQSDLEDTAIKLNFFCNGFEKEYTKEEISKLFIEQIYQINGEQIIEPKFAIEAAQTSLRHIVEDFPGSPSQKKQLLGDYLKDIGITDNNEETYAAALNKELQKNIELQYSSHNLKTTKPTYSSTQNKVHRMFDVLFNSASEEMNPVVYGRFVLAAGNFPSQVEQQLFNSMSNEMASNRWWEHAVEHAVDSGGELWQDDFERVKLLFNYDLLDGVMDNISAHFSKTKKGEKELFNLISDVKKRIFDYKDSNPAAAKLIAENNLDITYSDFDFFNNSKLFQNEEVIRQILPLESELALKYNRYISQRDDYLLDRYGDIVSRKYAKHMHTYLKDLKVLDNQARDKKIAKNLELENKRKQKSLDDGRSR